MPLGEDSFDQLINSLDLPVPVSVAGHGVELPPDGHSRIWEAAGEFLDKLDMLVGPVPSLDLIASSEPGAFKSSFCDIPQSSTTPMVVDPEVVAFLAARSEVELRLLTRTKKTAEQNIQRVVDGDVDIARVLEIGPNDIPLGTRLQVSPINAKLVVAGILASRYNFKIAPEELKISYRHQTDCPTFPVAWDPETGVMLFYKHTNHSHHKPQNAEKDGLLKVYGLTPYLETYSKGYMSIWHSLIAVRPDCNPASMRTTEQEYFDDLVKDRMVIMAVKYKQWLKDTDKSL